jgi:3-deoxy-7-phosphoheptulonate synthase / chorismate mutase
LSSDPDPVIRDLRGQISAADRTVLEAVNRRLELVAELKRYKESRGIAFVDSERERTMLEELARANGGPLSDEGVRELLTMLLDLTKREV